MGRWRRLMSGEASPEERTKAKAIAEKLFVDLTDHMRTYFATEILMGWRNHGECDNPFVLRGWDYYIRLSSSTLGSRTYSNTAPKARQWHSTYNTQIIRDRTPEIQVGVDELHAGMPRPSPNEMHTWLTSGRFPETWNRRETSETVQRIEKELREKYPD